MYDPEYVYKHLNLTIAAAGEIFDFTYMLQSDRRRYVHVFILEPSNIFISDNNIVKILPKFRATSYRFRATNSSLSSPWDLPCSAKTIKFWKIQKYNVKKSERNILKYETLL